MYDMQQYLAEITHTYKSGKATEHSYRSHLQALLESLSPDISAINEPKKDDFGAPDFIIKQKGKGISIGCIETKDFAEKVNRLDNLQGYEKNQLERYRKGSDNLVYTDYLDFIFYKNSEQVYRIRIADFDGKNITPKPENFDLLKDHLISFYKNKTTTIKSALKLAEIMALKARLVANEIYKALTDENDQESSLYSQMAAFQKMLIHDIQPKEFADVYAQTIAYGMFAARLNDKTLEDFSRFEAATLIPKTNPFLRSLFGYIAGPDIDSRIVWEVDNLADIFCYTDVAYIMKDFGRQTRTTDPIIHFYETFLAAYDPTLRKKRGVFYTPQPVVEYIVKSVDDILKSDFGLSKGLADDSKIESKTKIETQGSKRAKKILHKVQVLDPATGTGTFLAEVIKYIAKSYENDTGVWVKYVDEHLLPRIHGFELLMASYAMAHLKLDLVLRSTGYVQSDAPINERLFRQDDLFDTQLAEIGRNVVVKNTDKRLSVYLTNSLEEADPDTGTLFFAQWLSNEAQEANLIKRDIPVMCVIGNPPYSISSSNNNQFARDLIERYKTGLNERNIQPLSDDYIKFIALGQHYIEKNGSGILAFITNNSFIDGVIHRQMRHSLMETFDDIYILNLHGNSRRKETAPDGSKDENVFDIMAGVSINIFVKKPNHRSLATVHYADLFGLRNTKYGFLTDNSVKTTEFETLKPIEPDYFFIKKDFKNKAVYDKGFSVNELFMLNASGIKTQRDDLVIQQEAETIQNILSDFRQLDSNSFIEKWSVRKDERDWVFENAKADALNPKAQISKITYRPFDTRYTIYTGKTKGIMAYPRDNVMQHMHDDNIVLLTCRQQSSSDFRHVLVSSDLVDMCSVSSQTRETGYAFPLYTYYGGQQESNLDQRIVRQITDCIGRTAEPIEIFDYIYGILHNPKYRSKYREFLKTDFPRIPYPKDDTEFKYFVSIGSKLRKLHLMQELPVSTVKYPVAGTDVVDKPRYDNGRVYINNTQYFDGVSETAWEFFIGGYQPAQKWLKDRRGRTLTMDDIIHYKNIITVLSETAGIMSDMGEKTE